MEVFRSQFLLRCLFFISVLLALILTSSAHAEEGPDAIFVVHYDNYTYSQIGEGDWNQDLSTGIFTSTYNGSVSDTSVTANMSLATSGNTSSKQLGYIIDVLVRGKPSVTLTTETSGNVSVSSTANGIASAGVTNLPYNGATAGASKPYGDFPDTYTDAVSDGTTSFHDLGCGNGTVDYGYDTYYSTIPGISYSDPTVTVSALGPWYETMNVSANASVKITVTLGTALPTVKISDPEVNGMPVDEAITGQTVTFHDDGSFDPDNDPVSGTPGAGAGICSRLWTLIAPNQTEIASGTSSSFSFTPTVRGEYTVRLEATDNEGDTNTEQEVIEVEPPGPRGGICQEGMDKPDEYLTSGGPYLSSSTGPGFLSGIFPGTGNAFLFIFDPVSTRGFPLAVDISINSQSYFPNLAGPMGNARFTYGIHGRILTKDGQQYSMILDSDGQELNLGEYPGAFDPEPGIYSTPVLGSTTFSLEGAGPPGMIDKAGNFTYEFSQTNGKLLSVTDPEGNIQTVQYNGNGDPTSVLDVSSGRSITFEYDTPGRIARIVEGQGTAVTHLSYAGNLLSGSVLKDSNQNVIREIAMTYNAEGLLSNYIVGNDSTSQVNFSYQHVGDDVYFANFTRADGSGSNLEYFEEPPTGVQYKVQRSNAQFGETTFHVNSDGRITEKSTPAHNGASSGPTKTFAYTPEHKVQTYSDGATTITYTYNSAGKVVSSTVSGGQSLTYTYAGNGVDLLSAADQQGTFLSRAYADSNNPHRPTSVGDGQGNNWTYTYNVYGQTLTATPPSGSQQGATVYTYEENSSNADYGYLRSETNGAGDLRLFQSYSGLGDLLSYATHPNYPTADQAGFTYDPQRRITQAWFTNASPINYVYDDHFLDSIINENGNVTSYEYNKSSGQIEEINMPLSKSLELQHNSDLTVSAFIDAQSNQTSFTYGDAGELTREEYPDGHYRDYLYDDYGRLSEIQNSAGHERTLTYDSARRITQVDFDNPQQASISASYHPDGRYQVVTHEAGTETYTYDSSRRVQKISRDFTVSGLTRVQDLEYTYYADDRVQTLTWKDNGATVIVWSYSYDSAGRLTTVSTNLGDSITYAYDGEGKITSQTNSNGTVTEYTYYEPRNRVASIVHKTGGTPFESFSLIYDGGQTTVGNITQVTELDSSVVSYAYDSLDRLTSETRTGTTPFTNTYAYDLAGNVSTLNSSTFATYDTANKIATVPGGSASYDGIGNMLSVSGTGLTGSNYSWGARSELRTQDTGGTVTGYGYDASKRRVYRERGSDKRWFIFSQGVLVGEVTTSGALAAFTWGADGLAATRVFVTPMVVFYHFGPQGETRHLTDATGAVATSYLYDAYGNTVTAGMTNPYRFGGKYGYYSDGPTDAMLATWRWYSPQLMRWVSRDPIDYDGGDNLYGYVNGNPVTLVDPLGTDPDWIHDRNKVNEKGYAEEWAWSMVHCVNMCALTKRTNGVIADEIGDAVERQQVRECFIWKEPDMCASAYQESDFQDNETGIACAQCGEDCIKCCRASLRGMTPSELPEGIPTDRPYGPWWNSGGNPLFNMGFR